ncbi:hypothetical protein KAH37_06350 [bacterium]|nr:hypothetical protein [bacterium]
MVEKSPRKTNKIEVLCTDEQRDLIRKKAKNSGMSLSEFGLFTMINSQISVSIGGDPLLSSLNRLITMLDDEKISLDEFEMLKKRLLEQ